LEIGAAGLSGDMLKLRIEAGKIQFVTPGDKRNVLPPRPSARAHKYLHQPLRSSSKQGGTSAGVIRPTRERRSRHQGAAVNPSDPPSASAFQSIRAIDYTIIFVRDMDAMRRFYEDVLRFSLLRELSPNWIEYQIGGNTLALARPSLTAADAPTPTGSAALQLAFKVAAHEVDACADELLQHGIALVSPPTDRPFGHRTLFFRDPDGNLLEVFAEI
jgi:catechol 2,3-dioxygenase-like lactoylglutathione lyase family enzyme